MTTTGNTFSPHGCVCGKPEADGNLNAGHALYAFPETSVELGSDPFAGDTVKLETD